MKLRLAGLLLALAVPASAFAQGNLTLYCSVQEEWCRGVVTAFERKTGIKISMTRKSSGETYAQVKAEAANPRGDVWWGGTGDPHLQAAEEGLTLEYRSPMLKELQDWAVRQAEQSKFRTVGIYAGALGFGYNSELLAKKKLPEPKCWNDLLSGKYKDEVQVADPNSSGTAYTLLATMVQLQGEDKGHQVGCCAGQGGEPGRDPRRHRLHARPRDDGGGRRTGQGGRALRRHRLRSGFDEHPQGREEPRSGESLVRLRAFPRRAGHRRSDQVIPGAFQQERQGASSGAAP